MKKMSQMGGGMSDLEVVTFANVTGFFKMSQTVCDIFFSFFFQNVTNCVTNP